MSEIGLRILQKIIEKNPEILIVEPGMMRAENGTHKFEGRQPGCIEAYFKGLNYLMQNIDKPLTLELIKQTHYHMMNFQGRVQSLVPLGECRQTFMLFNIFDWRKTKEGEKELRDYIARYADDPQKPTYDKNSIYSAPFQNGNSDGNIEKSINKAVADYNRDIENLSENPSIKDRVRIIVKLIVELERLHPFADGNGRVFVNGLLNWLLIKNGLPPAVFEEPNIFDAYSIEQLVEATFEAMRVSLIFDENMTYSSIYGAALNAEIDDTVSGWTEEIRNTLSSKINNDELSDDEFNKISETQATLKEEIEEYLELDGNILRQIVFNQDIDIDEKVELEKDPILKTDWSTYGKNSPPFYNGGKHPIHIAIQCKNKTLVETLLKKYPKSKMATDGLGKTPFVFAIATRDREFIDLFLPEENPDKDGIIKILHQTVSFLDNEDLKYLLEWLTKQDQAQSFDEKDIMKIIELAGSHLNDKDLKYLLEWLTPRGLSDSLCQMGEVVKALNPESRIPTKLAAKIRSCLPEEQKNQLNKTLRKHAVELLSKLLLGWSPVLSSGSSGISDAKASSPADDNNIMSLAHNAALFRQQPSVAPETSPDDPNDSASVNSQPCTPM
jgi:prophage maintenance system killer protein